MSSPRKSLIKSLTITRTRRMEIARNLVSLSLPIPGQVPGKAGEGRRTSPGLDGQAKAGEGRTFFVRNLNLRMAQVFLLSLCLANANDTDIFQVRKPVQDNYIFLKAF